jgi:hypothetical protein
MCRRLQMIGAIRHTPAFPGISGTAAVVLATMSAPANAQMRPPGSFHAMFIRNARQILKAACDRNDAHCPARSHWVCGPYGQRCFGALRPDEAALAPRSYRKGRCPFQGSVRDHLFVDPQPYRLFLIESVGRIEWLNRQLWRTCHSTPRRRRLPAQQEQIGAAGGA